MIKVTYNLNSVFNRKWFEKLARIRKRSLAWRQEMFEEQYCKDICQIITDFPQQIEKQNWSGKTQYLIYSDYTILEKGPNKGQKILNGTFYTISSDDILLNGRSVWPNVSNKFIRRMYEGVVKDYNARFQPQPQMVR